MQSLPSGKYILEFYILHHFINIKVTENEHNLISVVFHADFFGLSILVTKRQPVVASTQFMLKLIKD